MHKQRVKELLAANKYVRENGPMSPDKQRQMDNTRRTANAIGIRFATPQAQVTA